MPEDEGALEHGLRMQLHECRQPLNTIGLIIGVIRARVVPSVADAQAEVLEAKLQDIEAQVRRAADALGRVGQ